MLDDVDDVDDVDRNLGQYTTGELSAFEGSEMEEVLRSVQFDAMPPGFPEILGQSGRPKWPWDTESPVNYRHL